MGLLRLTPGIFLMCLRKGTGWVAKLGIESNVHICHIDPPCCLAPCTASSFPKSAREPPFQLHYLAEHLADSGVHAKLLDISAKGSIVCDSGMLFVAL